MTQFFFKGSLLIIIFQCFVFTTSDKFLKNIGSEAFLPFSSEFLQVAEKLHELFKLPERKHPENLNLIKNPLIKHELDQFLNNRKEFLKIVRAMDRILRTVVDDRQQIAALIMKTLNLTQAIENDYVDFLNFKTLANDSDILNSFVNLTADLQARNSRARMLEIYNSIIDEDYNCLDFLANLLQDSKFTCNRNMSSHMILYKYYQLIRQSELKVFSAMRFAFDFIERNRKENKSFAVHLIRDQYERRDKRLRQLFEKAMLKASRAVRTCAPSSNKTYSEINTHKMYATPNLKDFEDYSSSCEYSIISTFNKKLLDDHLKVHDKNIERCDGSLINCEKLQESMCLSNIGNEKRYLELKDSTVHSPCFPKSKICMCMCDPYINKFRIHLNPIFSNFNDSRVITGARLRMRKLRNLHNELYIEIREGKLLPNGVIDPSSLKWKQASYDDLLIKKRPEADITSNQN